jgi:tRNA (guanine10-N2)-dimethyltransferase
MVACILEELKIGLRLSKANIEMSKAEAIESCKIYFEIASIVNINSSNTDNLLIINIKEPKNEQTMKRIRVWLDRLALTREAHLIVGCAKTEGNAEDFQTKFYLDASVSNESALIEQLANHKNDTKRELTFKISTKSLSNLETDKNQNLILRLAKELSSRGFHKTNMKSPNVEFTILNSNNPIPNNTLVGLKLWTNSNEFEKRHAHHRPILHPTAINPKLARAMINLARAEKEFFDPFCGCGGILLEGMLIGLKVKGTDISSEMIKRSKLNLCDAPNFDKAQLICKDAFSSKAKVECIVTDLPYGKSSKIQGSVSSMLNRFLIHYSDLTSKIAVCFPKGTPLDIPVNWHKKYEFSIYIHKSLTRNILVLERK